LEHGRHRPGETARPSLSPPPHSPERGHSSPPPGRNGGGFQPPTPPPEQTEYRPEPTSPAPEQTEYRPEPTSPAPEQTEYRPEPAADPPGQDSPDDDAPRWRPPPAPAVPREPGIQETESEAGQSVEEPEPPAVEPDQSFDEEPPSLVEFVQEDDGVEPVETYEIAREEAQIVQDESQIARDEESFQAEAPPLQSHEEPFQHDEPPLESTPSAAEPEPHAEPSGNGILGLTPPTRRGGSGRFITDHIVELGFASAERVETAMEEGRSSGVAPEGVLLDSGEITPDQLARATAERFGLDHLNLSLFDLDLRAINLIPLQAARRFEAVPVAFVGEGTVLVAMTDPTNVRAVDDISIMTGLDVRPAVASPDDVSAVMARISKLDTAVADAIEEGEEEEEAASHIQETPDNAPVVKLVNGVIAQAVDENASDVHFEPQGREIRVRYRVDGMLHDVTTIPRRMVAGVTSRLKIMGNLDIAERRLPQDGRISVVVEDRPIDVRVASLPAVHGEKVVLRLLDKNKALISLDQLGMEPGTLDSFRKSFTRAYGATLVTGPTGSGKTTSLYAALNIINTPEKNIITIEDPVEYQVVGITQVQVNVKTGLTFAQGLRSIVRSDPDVIMIGEIRDRETAQIAVESALTGHLVLSTLHTNDAPSAMTRLTEMGIEPFLSASAIDCVVSQRLARLLCYSCKAKVVLTAEQLRQSDFDVTEDIEAYEARGCPRCSHTGYKGRVGLYEAMRVTDEIRNLVIQRAPADSIRNIAVEQGMHRLDEDGLDKVRAGLTTIEEIARVTGSAISAD
jgi:type IV pilus assembly protein PilB